VIPLTRALDLGADRTRMKNRSDVERQNETARVLLDRLYNEQSSGFLQLQLLADEVGMGKTFVALAVAYSVLQAQQQETALAGCYGKVLVLVPQNEELKRKWHREVGEVVKRCSRPGHRDAVAALFRAKTVERPDELVAALRSGNESVVVAKTSAIGAQVTHRELKERLTLAALFRDFGRALPLETREILLKNAGDGWPKDPSALRLTKQEEGLLPLQAAMIEQAIRAAAQQAEFRSERDKILALCKEWGSHGVRGRTEGFKVIRHKALEFYKTAVWTLLASDLPLVIVDEAHQWKHKKNGFTAFDSYIAPRTRRVLLLTATPFQLHRSEILTLLAVGDSLKLTKNQLQGLADARDRAVKPALERAHAEGAMFSQKWSKLGSRLEPEALRDVWGSDSLRAAREKLVALAREPGALEERAVEQVVESIRLAVPVELRDLVCQALRLYAFNRDLGDELGRFVVRHRRSTQHRVVRAGHEIDQASNVVQKRPDAHVLHPAPGLDVRGDDELPLYLLMRATSELEDGKRTANLGSSLTGCYSTFFKSAASAPFSKADKNQTAATYVGLLKNLVGEPSADATHPKMRRVVEEVVKRWEHGEKSLVFTFRVNTAERLHDLVKSAIRERLEAKQREVFGAEGGIVRLRQRLSSKVDSLYQPMLDRVLWSLLWAPPDRVASPIESTSLRPNESDYRELARLALAYEQEVTGERPDRVFLHRAAEHTLARRLRDAASGHPRLRQVLNEMAKESWVTHPYGIVADDDEAPDHANEATVGDELGDERGVQSVYRRVKTPHDGEIEQLSKDLKARDQRAYSTKKVGVVRQAFVGPSFWLGADPEHELMVREHNPADVEVDKSDQRFLHVQLCELSGFTADAAPDFRTRALAFKAMRRAMLRESILVRLLPKHERRDDESWASLLVQQFTQAVAGRESLLRLVGVFVEDLAGASGSISDPKSARGSLYQATTNKDAVSIVKGDTDNDTRSRRFQGFNTPLLPEILICGQVAQEGIDLHRQCSHVVHYDLAWNPATLEQRTGRVDRIGSRTQRLRQLGAGDASADAARLEVSAPYLAGTYDERMFEELRLRAQTFEVLLGGDLSGAGRDGAAPAPASSGIEGAPEDEGESCTAGLTALPEQMAESLRVDLAVWRDSGGVPSS